MTTSRGSAFSETYWSPKAGDGNPGPYDVIVIGSGMGGMTAAAMLTKLGRKVLVLEQHYYPGGFTHTFKRHNYVWDVGVHAIGEVTEKSLTGRLLADLTGGRLKWNSLGKVYEEFYFPDLRIDFPDNPAAFRENLLAAFPDEAPAIDGYFKLVGQVAASMRGYFLARSFPRRLGWLARLLYPNKADKFFGMITADAINGLTKNEKLRGVLTAQWGYYGSPPSRASFAIQALVARHFFHGGYYPVGGSQQIAQQMLKTVADGGGWTRIKADVEAVTIKNGKATGVRLRNGEEIAAKQVISAAGAMRTIHSLLPEEFKSSEWARSIGALAPAPCHVCLYIGFKGDITKAGASGANKWFYGQWESTFDAWDVSDPERLPPVPVMYCSFPSLKDPLHDPGPENLHTGEVVTFVPWSAFEKWKGTRWHKRGEDYTAYKEAMTKVMLEQYLAHMPELRPMVDYVELSTPLSTDHFVRPMNGSIYGIEPTPERFANESLRPHTPIKNLFLAGSEVASVGVMGAMMGGILAATAAEPRKGMAYFKKFMKPS